VPTATDERIGLREAAERLGVHYMTAYRYVRSGRLPADKVGDEWRVRVADLHAVRPGRPDAPADRPRSPATARRLEDRLVAGDEAGAWRILEEAAAAGMPPSALLVELLAPALRSIGDRWAAGELVIADEHRASAVAARLVGRLGPRHTRPGRRRGTIVLGAVAGDRHGLPTAIMGDLLRGAGFEVVDLGADTPAASFVDAARSLDRLVAVGVCITAPEALDGAAGQVRHLRRELPGVPVVVGGGAVPDAATARALGSDGFAADPGEVVDLFGSFTPRSVG
jgi:excisionase family DNA binding protein